MPKIEQQKKPKLTNRGPAGLLTKKTGTLVQPVATALKVTTGPGLWEEAPKDNFRGSLEALVIEIDGLTEDPENARLHPERNMVAIKDSLAVYGQTKPIVVRKDGMVITAGNGTYRAAKELGWTKIAANVIDDMDRVEGAGYGLADNRTAELAKWDFEIVARIDKLLQEAGQASVGWSVDELEVLRAADWVPPPVEEGGFGAGEDGKGDKALLVSFSPDQHEIVEKAIAKYRTQAGGDGFTMDQADCISAICQEWLEYQDA